MADGRPAKQRPTEHIRLTSALNPEHLDRRTLDFLEKTRAELNVDEYG